jgi:hypothetical protein
MKYLNVISTEATRLKKLPDFEAVTFACGGRVEIEMTVIIESVHFNSESTTMFSFCNAV